MSKSSNDYLNHQEEVQGRRPDVTVICHPAALSPDRSDIIPGLTGLHEEALQTVRMLQYWTNCLADAEAKFKSTWVNLAESEKALTRVANCKAMTVKLAKRYEKVMFSIMETSFAGKSNYAS